MTSSVFLFCSQPSPGKEQALLMDNHLEFQIPSTCRIYSKEKRRTKRRWLSRDSQHTRSIIHIRNNTAIREKDYRESYDTISDNQSRAVIISHVMLSRNDEWIEVIMCSTCLWRAPRCHLPSSIEDTSNTAGI
jgi:hypothetical protein